MNGDQVRFYWEVNNPQGYPKVPSRVLNGTTQAEHLTLEGAVQNFLDGIHQILALQKGGVELDGALAQQANLQYALSNIDGLAQFWPRFYLDSLTPGKTAQETAAEYKQQAAALFAAYGL